jgi:hypothetical protein
MVEVKSIELGDRQVLVMDFSRLHGAVQLATATDDAIAAVRATQRPHALLAVLDLTGTPVSRSLLRSLRRLSENNGPFVQAMAFAGLSLIPRCMLNALLRSSGRLEHRAFRTRAEALAWLGERAARP